MAATSDAATQPAAPDLPRESAPPKYCESADRDVRETPSSADRPNSFLDALLRALAGVWPA
jgi:hypothetical protein